MKKTIGCIGTGNMGKAMLKGMINSQKVDASSIYAYDLYQPGLEKVCEELNINKTTSEIEVAQACDIIFIALKPYTVVDVLTKIKSSLKKDVIIISIAAGVELKTMNDALDNQVKVVRCMPNTPALVLEGMTSISINDKVNEEDQQVIKELLETFGKACFIPEALNDAVIAVSGSAPAYIFVLIEAMADGAVKAGMSRAMAYEFASQTVLGSAKMVMETKMHPGELKDMVCSPGGTTIDAVAQLEASGFRNAIISAMDKCIEKIQNQKGEK